MPLIPFPDVPALSGVPTISRAASKTSGALLAVAASIGYGSQFNGPQWQILMSSGAVALIPDSVIAFEYRNENRVLNYPVENGAFASYNKIASPFDLRLVMACGGKGTMTREAFLKSLGIMVNSLLRFTIVTPDASYPNCSMVSLDYQKTNSNGAKMVVASCNFVEVRPTAKASYQSTQKPSGANPVSNGSVSVTAPTAAQVGKLVASGVK